MSALAAVWEKSQYIAINVSSPNTPGLRDLQAVDHLRDLVLSLREENHRLADHHGSSVRPLFLKIAPDLADEDLEAIAKMALETKLDAVIATNTTINAQLLDRPPPFTGGISGDPLCARALECTRILYRALGPAIPIIGVGGIRRPSDAYERIRAGASLLQIYSGFVFEGPALVGRLCHGLTQRLRADGFERVSDAVGVDS
jgi:dihydroorotate dehydrogenase